MASSNLFDDLSDEVAETDCINTDGAGTETVGHGRVTRGIVDGFLPPCRFAEAWEVEVVEFEFTSASSPFP